MDKVRITDVITTEYSDFLSFCSASGKVYVSELTNVDFVAFRASSGQSRDYIKAIRAILDNPVVISGTDSKLTSTEIEEIVETEEESSIDSSNDIISNSVDDLGLKSEELITQLDESTEGTDILDNTRDEELSSTPVSKQTSCIFGIVKNIPSCSPVFPFICSFKRYSNIKHFCSITQ